MPLYPLSHVSTKRKWENTSKLLSMISPRKSSAWRIKLSSKKDKRKTFFNLITVLTTVMEGSFGVAFHSGGTALPEHGFGIVLLPEIFSRFQHNYERPVYQEIKASLFRLT